MACQMTRLPLSSMRLQPAISLRVRKQPSQSSLLALIRQTDMHGDGKSHDSACAAIAKSTS